jgi:hypothetical protein
MLRRDYIIDQIEEFAEVLARILGFTKASDWQSASEAAAREVQKLVGVDMAEAVKLSETALFARLIQSEPTHVAERRVFMLAQLFKASGEIAGGQGRADEARAYFLKGLDLMLDTLDHTAIGARPDFVPAVDLFVLALAGEPLPAKTLALLMRHYERTGQFARAEDALFDIADGAPGNPQLPEFGESFYQRLFSQTDVVLAKGNLSREEARAGLADFRAKIKAS